MAHPLLKSLHHLVKSFRSGNGLPAPSTADSAWSTKSSPSTHRLATAPVLIVTSAILPPIRTPSMTIPITLPVSLSRLLRPSPQRCPILQTTNWAKAAADSGLDLLADLPAPKADLLETVSDAPATSSQELLVFNCDNSTPNSALRHVEDAIEKINTRVEAHNPLSTPCRPSTPWPY